MNLDELGVELGDLGLEWVERSLSSGLAISEAFIELGALASMRSLALVPPNTPLDLLNDPEADMLSSGRAESIGRLAVFLQKRCGGGGGVFVVEDELARPDDPWIQEQGLDYPHFTRGEELYHFLAVWPTVEAGRVDDFLSESTAGYPTNAFVLPTPPAEFAESVSGELSGPTIARTVDSVVVSAYDDVGYIAAFPAPEITS